MRVTSGARNLQRLKAPGYIHGSQRVLHVSYVRSYEFTALKSSWLHSWITKGLLQLKLVLS